MLRFLVLEDKPFWKQRNPSGSKARLQQSGIGLVMKSNPNLYFIVVSQFICIVIDFITFVTSIETDICTQRGVCMVFEMMKFMKNKHCSILNIIAVQTRSKQIKAFKHVFYVTKESACMYCIILPEWIRDKVYIKCAWPWSMMYCGSYITNHTDKKSPRSTLYSTSAWICLLKFESSNKYNRWHWQFYEECKMHFINKTTLQNELYHCYARQTTNHIIIKHAWDMNHVNAYPAEYPAAFAANLLQFYQISVKNKSVTWKDLLAQPAI